MTENTKLVVVQIRGTVNTHPDVRKTLELLRLKQKHSCVVIDKTPESLGMLKRVKDYASYGTIDKDFYKLMLEKRGESVGKGVKIDFEKVANEYFEGKVKLRDFEETYKLKPFFRLHPPIGGFERKGIKMPYAKGGVLGERKEKIKDLLIKML